MRTPHWSYLPTQPITEGKLHRTNQWARGWRPEVISTLGKIRNGHGCWNPFIISLIKHLYSFLSILLFHSFLTLSSEHSVAAKTGGCFPGGALVTMEDGSHRPIRDLRAGDLVLASMGSDGTGELDSKVLTFLDRSPITQKHFYVISTEDGASVSLTAAHLLFLWVGNCSRGAGQCLGPFRRYCQWYQARSVFADRRRRRSQEACFTDHSSGGAGGPGSLRTTYCPWDFGGEWSDDLMLRCGEWTTASSLGICTSTPVVQLDRTGSDP